MKRQDSNSYQLLHSGFSPLFQDANVNLRKWKNNCKEINEYMMVYIHVTKDSTEETIYATIMPNPVNNCPDKI